MSACRSELVKTEWYIRHMGGLLILYHTSILKSILESRSAYRALLPIMHRHSSVWTMQSEHKICTIKGTGSAIFWYFFDDFSLKQNILYVIVLTKGCVMASYCARVVNRTVRLIHINNFMVATKKM